MRIAFIHTISRCDRPQQASHQLIELGENLDQTCEGRSLKREFSFFTFEKARMLAL
ncbi:MULTISPECIES: hypothetical protein [Calothrix]|uniref:Uncharacterized protein n=2 Tax=Calothrix TaxID=1186 RepID=A0ABR8AHU3_9CYAN|nr:MULTISPECIES: hypothetical protein [Calothrix]MBD2199513.1 hypothetical protein [Calothrix parietina FACHB-288]MBD2228107.1 hypothetical protein [Calothrix anomala FACHB-343]